MEMRLCIYCKQEKTINSFIRHNRKCRECRLSYQKQYHRDNKEKIHAHKKQYRNDHIDHCKTYERQYHKINKYRNNQRSKEYHANHKREASLYDKLYRAEHKDEIKAYRHKRREDNVNIRLLENNRCRISKILRCQDIHKMNTSLKYLGCTITEFKAYLESKFQPGMSWDNYGFYGWHVDHIRPLASFDLSDLEQLTIAFHYTNTQPLWAKDNFEKSNKILDSMVSY